LQSVNDQEDVMIYDWLIASLGQPRPGPRREALEGRMRVPAKAIVKQILEDDAVLCREHGFAARLDREPDGESVGQAFQWWGQPAAVALSQQSHTLFKT
jgi:hypothetical protein